MKRNIFIKSIVSFFFAFAIFAEVTVVNPVAGNFANPQTLIIESNGGEDIYYSFTGSDPLTSGFAYDGPVLLDVTGNVDLRVVAIDENSKRQETKVSYSVKPTATENVEHNAFLASMQESIIVEYVAGDKIAIPFTMAYSFGGPFERGKEISLSKDVIVERYLPLSVRDAANNEWRFVLYVMPSVQGQLSRREVPFKISNWTRLTFTDPRLIYSLDGSWWYNSSDIVTLDRSVENTIYYQSAEYSPENPITKIVMPPKPSLKLEHQFDGALKITVNDNPVFNDGETLYKISSSASAKNNILPQGLYSEIYFDVFAGDKIEELYPFDIYSDGVFQGTLFALLDINRVTPNVPTIKSSVEGYYARDDVQVQATAQKNLRMFVGICDPLEVSPSFEYKDLSELKFNVPTFAPYDGKRLTFFADMEKILAYKVSFYSEDAMGVKSETVSYSVIVDKYNYYVDASSTAQKEDGTPFAPFKDLSKIAKIVNASRFTRFFVKGNVKMGLGEVSLRSNVEFSGLGEAKIEIPETSVIIIKNAGLFAENLIFEKTQNSTHSKKPRAAAKALTNMFIIENSAATFSNCAVVGNFPGDGTTINLSSSVLNLNKSSIVNTAQAYSSVINALSSKIKIMESSLVCNSDTAVCFSANGGNFVLENSSVQITGRMARAGEFIGGTVSLENNKFDIKSASTISISDAFYKTENTQFIKNVGTVFK